MITCSVATAKALLKFASSDKAQPHIFGIGITANGLGATDGFASVEFTLPCGPNDPKEVGRTIDRKMFETSAKLCAVTKTWLQFTGNYLIPDQQRMFPDFQSVMPDKQQMFPGEELMTSREIKIVPEYLALLYLVTTACETSHVTLSSVKSDSPMRFDVQGPTQSAIVLISHQ